MSSNQKLPSISEMDPPEKISDKISTTTSSRPSGDPRLESETTRTSVPVS